MRKAAALAAAFAVLLVACSKHGSAKLEGRWRGVRADGVAPEAQQSANAFATGTEIAAKGNQIAISTPAAKAQQATYFIDSEDKTVLVIHTDKDAAHETFQFSDDGKTLIWRLDERRTLTFVKQ